MPIFANYVPTFRNYHTRNASQFDYLELQCNNIYLMFLANIYFCTEECLKKKRLSEQLLFVEIRLIFIIIHHITLKVKITCKNLFNIQFYFFAHYILSKIIKCDNTPERYGIGYFYLCVNLFNKIC